MSLNPSENSAAAPTPTPRRGIPLALAIVLILVVAGVSAGGTAVYFFLHPTTSSPSTNNTTIVTDDLGRAVKVPRDPSRVAVLGPNVMDSMFLLGLRSHVVGIDCSNTTDGGLEGDYTPGQVANWSLSSIPCITAYPAISSADLLAVNPQVVLASSTLSIADLESFSATYGIPLVIFDPSTLGGVVYDVQMLADIFGATHAVTSLVTELQVALSASSSFLANLSYNGTSLVSVFMTYYPVPAGTPSAGYYTFGPGSFGQSLIELSGGTNIAGNSISSDPELSGSQVLAADPGYVIYGNGFGVNATSYAQGPNWNQIPAVEAGNVTGIDVTLMTEVDPAMVLAIPIFEKILYPALFPA
jgi:iron complex transport system substrate-binding protein